MPVNLHDKGAVIISVLSLVTFTGALIVAFLVKDEGLLNLTVGAAIANASAAVQYWIGSSSTAAKKDDIIAAQANGGAH